MRMEPNKPRILVLVENNSAYAECVKRAGGQPVSVSGRDVKGVEEAFDLGNIEGLLLTGGGDVDPRLYGCKPNKHTYGVNETRDRVEMYALAEARERGIPVMGICRGSQIMNIEAGGTLRQHIGGHVGGTHLVTASYGSLAAHALGAQYFSPVSLHHQVVLKAGRGFKVSIRARGGSAEGIEGEDGRCLGVQFHPERSPHIAFSRSVFRWLVVESARRAGVRLEPLPAPPRKSNRTAKGFSPVKTSWYCPKEGIRFDKREDYVDHMDILHGVAVVR